MEKYPDWHEYKDSTGTVFSAYLCNDKDWYVIHPHVGDCYRMEQKFSFENGYTLIERDMLAIVPAYPKRRMRDVFIRKM